MSTTATPVNNGVNSDALLGARDALRESPAAAEFVWRATSEWVDGTYSRQTIEHFDGLGAGQSHKKAFVLEGDHPEVFASEDRAPTPGRDPARGARRLPHRRRGRGRAEPRHPAQVGEGRGRG